MPRCIVIGGGISGLAAANRWMELSGSNEDCQLELIEATDRLGGVVSTDTVDGCPVELGPDMFLTEKPELVSLCERLGLADDLIPTEKQFRGALVLRRGRPLRVPAGFSLLAPARVWPALRTPLFSVPGKLRLSLEPLIPRRTAPEDESVASFVRRRLGREVLDRLVQPLVGGIYTGDPERLSLRATVPRFETMERERGSLWRGMRRQPTNASGARYALFVTAKRGMSSLINALEDRLRPNSAIRLRTSVTSIRRDGANWIVTTDDGIERSADGVIVALPASRASKLLKDIHPTLSNHLAEIRLASSAVVVTSHALADIVHPLDASGLVVPALERRQVLAVSFASRKFAGRAPEGRVVLRSFVGGVLQPELLERDDRGLIEMVSRELAQMLGLRKAPDTARVVRYREMMPQYDVGHCERVDRIEAAGEELPAMALAGNAYRGVGLPDCVRSGERAAESVWSSLAAASE